MKLKKLNSSLVEVHPEDFDVQTLRQAAREGRLYVAQPPLTEEEAKAKLQKGCAQILDYVKRIDCYATLPAVGELWSEIVSDELIQPTLFFKRYSRNRGEVNWYRVTAIVCLLREEEVYQKKVTAVQLHCVMEGTKSRTSVYSGMGGYLFNGQEIKRIKAIVRKFGISAN